MLKLRNQTNGFNYHFAIGTSVSIFYSSLYFYNHNYKIVMDSSNMQEFEENRHRSKLLAMRMRSGTGVNRIVGGQQSDQTHYIDALERFQKDYATYDKQKRELDKKKRQEELQRKRLQHLERQNKRWEVVEENEHMKEEKIKHHMQEVLEGKKRTANSNGLAYNPINLTYDHNAQGDKLRRRDEDHKIRAYVRAYNMDHHGNGAYDILNGAERRGVDKIIPNELSDRYMERLHEFEDSRKLKAPQTSTDRRRNIFHYY